MSKGIRRILKTVAVGDRSVGETSMFFRYAWGKFPDENVSTVFESVSVNGEINGKLYNLGLYDTVGGEDFVELRPLSYPDTDVFLLLFSVFDSIEFFEGIYCHWWREITRYCPGVPIILLGSKIDLRKNGIVTIPYEQGVAMAKTIKAARYMEISSLEDLGLSELFEEVARTAHDYNKSIRRSNRKGRKCLIL